jgi:hypothetical protein
MPVIYHHLQYHYRDLGKFKERSHRFMMFGLIPAGLTLYLALEIALSFTFGREVAFGLMRYLSSLYTCFSKRESSGLIGEPGDRDSIEPNRKELIKEMD